MLNLLPEPQVARFIRLLPQTWLQGGDACLRAEILACPVSGGQPDAGRMSRGKASTMDSPLYHEFILHQILMTCPLRPLQWDPLTLWTSGITITRP